MNPREARWWPSWTKRARGRPWPRCPERPHAARSEVLHVAVAAQALEPAVAALTAHLLDENPLDLVAHLVEGLNPRVFPVLSVEEEAALWGHHGIGAIALLGGKQRLAELGL